LDESGVNTGMTRLYGRALNGNRVNDYVPDVRFERISILSSIRLDGTMVPLTFEGALNGDLFKAYIKDCLAPTLKKGDIVVMDNLSSHKVKGVTEPITKAGATVVYLPPYSPDFNPIELLWSKVKAYLKKVKVRSSDKLFEAIADALNTISLSDISNWFAHDNYSIC
jgi:transposase